MPELPTKDELASIADERALDEWLRVDPTAQDFIDYTTTQRRRRQTSTSRKRGTRNGSGETEPTVKRAREGVETEERGGGGADLDAESKASLRPDSPIFLAGERKSFVSSMGLDILLRANDPRFIRQLLQSEEQLLRWKRKQYQAKQNASDMNAARSQQRIARFKEKKLSEASYKDDAQMLDEEVRRSVAYEGIIFDIDARLRSIGAGKSTPDRKKKDIEEMVLRVEQIEGPEREPVRSGLYERLLTFSVSAAPFIDTYANNFVLMGGPGVGKTTVAQVIGFALNRMGLLLTRNIYERSESDLLGAYVGQTSPRTRAALDNALEGVLFIDEAYSFTPCPAGGNRKVSSRGGASTSSSPYGKEAINTLVGWSSEFKGLISIIVAGYKPEMTDCFLTSNPGLPRRFASKWDLPNYSVRALFDILDHMVAARNEVAAVEFPGISGLASMFGVAGSERILEEMSALLAKNPLYFEYQGGDVANLADQLLQQFWLALSHGPASVALPLLSPTESEASIVRAFRNYAADKDLLLMS